MWSISKNYNQIASLIRFFPPAKFLLKLTWLVWNTGFLFLFSRAEYTPHDKLTDFDV